VTNLILVDDTDVALHDAAKRYLHDSYSFEKRMRWDPLEQRFNGKVWQDMAEMGWLSAGVSEDQGGLGVRIHAMVLLAEVCGEYLVNEPLYSSGFVAPIIMMAFVHNEQSEHWLSAVMTGEWRVACGFASSGADFVQQSIGLSGRAEVLLHADVANHLLVQARDRDGELFWHLVDCAAKGVTVQPYPLVDGRGAGTVVLDSAPSVRVSLDLLCDAELLGALSFAADSFGCMQAALRMTLEYIKVRIQFGKPIGANQVLQHRAVDMYLRVCESRALLNQASISLASQLDTAALDVHAAKAFIATQSRLMLQEALQLHGGIGMTEEYAVSHYLRRVLVNEQLFGGPEYHLQSFVQSLSKTPEYQ
jgi:alkylation response protein AidB-like acyl-CoA dehydrogenase